MTSQKRSPKIVVKIHDDEDTEKPQIKKQPSPMTSPFEPLAEILVHKEKGKSQWTEFYEKKLQENKKLQSNLTHNELTSMISKEWKKIKKQQKKTTKHQNINNVLNQKVEEPDKIKQLKNMSLKLVFDDIAFELKGEIVLDALQRNCELIYLSSAKEDNNQSPGTEDDEEQIPNKIRKYL